MYNLLTLTYCMSTFINWWKMWFSKITAIREISLNLNFRKISKFSNSSTLLRPRSFNQREQNFHLLPLWFPLPLWVENFDSNEASVTDYAKRGVHLKCMTCMFAQRDQTGRILCVYRRRCSTRRNKRSRPSSREATVHAYVITKQIENLYFSSFAYFLLLNRQNHRRRGLLF